VAGDVRVECKTTGSKAYPLKLSEIEKIKAEALMGGGESWAMQIQFETMSGNKKFAVIDWAEFEQLRQASKSRPDDMESMSGVLGPRGFDD
jgi:hypothetical protein